MANNYMADLSGVLGAGATYTSKNSTSRANNTELNMEDFLTLMIVQLQNQTIDDTADTSEMLNQMVQMQMITALTNMTDASLMSYASSLVGKEVTIGISGSDGLEERVITVIGTGVSDGQQVIFGSDGNTYALSQIMAVGRLPEIKQPELPDDSTDKPVDGVDKPGEGETPDNSTDKPVEGTDETVDGAGKPADDRPVTPDDGTGDNTPDEGGNDAVDPTAPTEGT